MTDKRNSRDLMVEASENSALHTHHLPGTLPGRAPHPRPTVPTRREHIHPCATEEDMFLVRGDIPGILLLQMLQRSVPACQ